MGRLNEIRQELQDMAEREAMKWWRIARRAEKKGCSVKFVHSIREEAHWLYTTATAYPERLVAWDMQYKHQFIFR